jgi:hypothetical protein
VAGDSSRGDPFASFGDDYSTVVEQEYPLALISVSNTFEGFLKMPDGAEELAKVLTDSLLRCTPWQIATVACLGYASLTGQIDSSGDIGSGHRNQGKKLCKRMRNYTAQSESCQSGSPSNIYLSMVWCHDCGRKNLFYNMTSIIGAQGESPAPDKCTMVLLKGSIQLDDENEDIRSAADGRFKDVESESQYHRGVASLSEVCCWEGFLGMPSCT